MFKMYGLIAVIMPIALSVLLAPEATPAVGLAAVNSAHKGDRLDLGRNRVACAWLQDSAACEHEGTGAADGVHKVRVVPIYRIPTFDQRPAPDLQPDHASHDRHRCASLPPSCVSVRESSRSMT